MTGLDRWNVLQWLGRLLKYSTLAAGSDRFGYGYVTLPPGDPGKPQQPRQQRVRFMQWFGFRSRPVVSGGEAIVGAPRGGPTNAVALAADHLGYGPTDLQEGEVACYDKAGSVIRLSADGSVNITSKSGVQVLLDPQGDVTVVPKAGRAVKLGDASLVNLDAVVLFTALKSYIDSHTHSAGLLMAGMTAVSGTSGSPVNGLPQSCASDNVLAKT
jgi:phage gp45-like